MDKKQIFLIIGIILLLIGIPLAIILIGKPMTFRLGAQNANRPENVSISGITSQSATVTWTTARATQGGVNYGVSATALNLFKPEAGPSVSHLVTLDGLLSGTRYYFSIKVGDQNFDDEGQPYSFTTQARAGGAPTPTSAPLTEEGLRAAMGTNNTIYDLNRDGIVNTLDLEIFRSQQK